ncbi:MalY/PatB family protein [Bacillus sp. JJ1566]|uniref:MalY/PatB family protein n=1 Tax=Bacillus sp. JJ1566 TaxID=3122961 RepID=UPI002FFD65D9
MFNQIIDRKCTNAAKLLEAFEEIGSDEIITLSVADMDFRSSPEIVNKLVEFANHGIYGYTNITDHYNNAVKTWMKKRYDWEISKDWIVFCPRIIQAVSLLIQNNTKKGDKIVIQTPLYSPLKNAIELNEREVVTNPLAYINNRYQMDFEDLEYSFSAGAKAFILCSPHNPVGRVWEVEELSKIVDLCEMYRVLLIADEVHADFTYKKKHIPIGKIPTNYHNMVICTSPAKTFNLPGLEVSNIIIPDPVLRASFKKSLRQSGIHNPSFFAVPALETAYLYGEEWLEQLKHYILENYRFTREFIHDNLPELKVIQADGTYLMWIDCRETGLNDDMLKQWFFKKAKVAVSLGSSFGIEGKGFIRLNIATPRSRLEEALKAILATYPNHTRNT